MVWPVAVGSRESEERLKGLFFVQISQLWSLLVCSVSFCRRPSARQPVAVQFEVYGCGGEGDSSLGGTWLTKRKGRRRMGAVLRMSLVEYAVDRCVVGE